MTRGAGLCAACALLLAHCTGEAYLGAIPRPVAGPDAAGAGGDVIPPPSAAGQGGSAATDPARDAEPARDEPDDGPRGGDAGHASDDAGVVAFATEGPCLRQASFEGTPSGVLFGVATVPTPWSACFTLQDATYSAPLCVNETTLVDTGGQMPVAGVLPRARAGSTYLYLDTSFGGQGQSTTQVLCDTLRAGQTYGFAVDLLSPVGQLDRGMPLTAGQLQVYLAQDSCSLNDGPLWVSPPLSAAWTRHCVLLTPPRDANVLILRLALVPPGRSAIGIDDIRLEPGCGTPLP